TPGSPYYDAEIASDCTTSHPCTIPLFGETGFPQGDIQNGLWVASILRVTDGAINPVLVDVTFLTLVLGSLYSAPGESPLPVYTLGWSPDYPAPSDYINPLWKPNSTYTFADAVEEQAILYTQSGANGCPSYLASQYWLWANYSQNNPGIPQDCQGTAYLALNDAYNVALHTSNGAQLAVLYAEISQIGRALGLYTYQYEEVGGWVTAPWIDISSLGTQQVSASAGLDQVFYLIQGNGILPT
ncbi:MAG TPA: hypothetical protein VEL82_06905, partial [Thermoplasmata archaeon]|nr:hypothetical protein [Thermoplasmata archaeon]